jgi:ABC-type Mn2+/Zn2+ transport system ATPase subunit
VSRSLVDLIIRGTLPPDAPRVLDVSKVTMKFGERTVLEDVSFWVPKGEFLCLCGPNGAGKSTLLKAILGLTPPTSGKISVLGMDPMKARHQIGYVPQRKAFDRDFPASPLEVVVAAIRGKWPLVIHKAEREKAMASLERAGAAKLAHAQMKDLSGGETQRVFLARALVNDPQLVILDEPTAGVDVAGRAAIVELMAQISASDTIAAVLVTHNLQAIARCAERVVYLDRTVKAWGLWNELSPESGLSAIYVGGSDHKQIEMDGD